MCGRGSITYERGFPLRELVEGDTDREQKPLVLVADLNPRMPGRGVRLAGRDDTPGSEVAVNEYFGDRDRSMLPPPRRNIVLPMRHLPRCHQFSGTDPSLKKPAMTS